jgi:predicted AAA+ superfamily ATPase
LLLTFQPISAKFRYSQLLNPRPEVLSEDGIEGIIDLANLNDRRRRKIEAKPGTFLSLTYPTSDIARVVQRLHERFTKRGETPALFLFEGLKGSGKSHLLVLMS